MLRGHKAAKCLIFQICIYLSKLIDHPISSNTSLTNILCVNVLFVIYSSITLDHWAALDGIQMLDFFGC